MHMANLAKKLNSTTSTCWAMQNVFDAGKVPYEAAPPLVPRTLSQKLSFLSHVVWDITVVLVMSLPNWLEALYHLFVSRRKKSVKGQLALITGGGNGIGKAIAFELAKHGCNIAIADIDHRAAVSTANSLTKLQIQAKGYCIDVSDGSAVRALRKQIEIDIGPVDILINNAGLMPLLSLREGTEEEIERIVKVNVTANYFTTRTFLPGMMERRRGHIAQISSMSSLHPMPGAVIYSSTKFACLGYIQALAQELRQEGYGDCINFTSVHPYFVSTRKDLMEALNLRFAAISAEETAEVCVEAILRNEAVVAVPRMDKLFAALVRSLPLKNQHLVRDYVLREKQSRMFKLPESK